MGVLPTPTALKRAGSTGLFKAGTHGPETRVFNSEHIFADAAVDILNAGLGKLTAKDYQAPPSLAEALEEEEGDAWDSDSKPVIALTPKMFDSCKRSCKWKPCCHDQVCSGRDAGYHCVSQGDPGTKTAAAVALKMAAKTAAAAAVVLDG